MLKTFPLLPCVEIVSSSPGVLHVRHTATPEQLKELDEAVRDRLGLSPIISQSTPGLRVYGTLWKIESFGRVYRSNGATYGPTGTISGIPTEYVPNHIEKAAERREHLRITNQANGEPYPKEDKHG